MPSSRDLPGPGLNPSLYVCCSGRRVLYQRCHLGRPGLLSKSGMTWELFYCGSGLGRGEHSCVWAWVAYILTSMRGAHQALPSFCAALRPNRRSKEQGLDTASSQTPNTGGGRPQTHRRKRDKCQRTDTAPTIFSESDAKKETAKE